MCARGRWYCGLGLDGNCKVWVIVVGWVFWCLVGSWWCDSLGLTTGSGGWLGPSVQMGTRASTPLPFPRFAGVLCLGSVLIAV